MNVQGELLRKQYLVSERNVKKLKEIATLRGTSAAEIVRQAIDAYDPLGPDKLEAPELMALVSEKLKEAILSTRKAHKRVERAILTIDQVNV